MKSNIRKISVGALLLFLLAGAAGQASAQVIVAPAPVVVGQCLYDAAGIPIWGYGTRGRAIYAYDPAGLPIYAFERIYSGCYVPDWGFRDCYHGPRWPRGIVMRPHGFRPGPAAAPRPHHVPGPGIRHHGPQHGPHHGAHGGGAGPRPGPGPRSGGHGGPGRGHGPRR